MLLFSDPSYTFYMPGAGKGPGRPLMLLFSTRPQAAHYMPVQDKEARAACHVSVLRSVLYILYARCR